MPKRIFELITHNKNFMQIKLKQISYRNFKGIVDFTINLDPISTHIFGENGTGKTSLMDGFMWLLFGKDSDGRSDFEIKTLDPYNNPIHRIEHEVNAIFDVDGVEINLRRIYKEKWTKKKGFDIAVFDGHVQEFFCNDVPMQQKEYSKKVSELIQEDMFKLLTNPLYFNSLAWQKRRELLFAIATTISNEYIAHNKPEYQALVQELTRKSIDEYKKELAGKKKLLKDQLINIPARIDEADRNKPEAPDVESINKIIDVKKGRIAEIDSTIGDAQKAIEAQMQAYQLAVQNKNALITKVADLKRQDSIAQAGQTQGLESELSIQENKLAASQRQALDYKNAANHAQNNIGTLSAELNILRGKWGEENAKTIVFSQDTSCPTCKQMLPAGDIASQREQQERNFNESKSKKLAQITADADSIKQRIETLNGVVNDNTTKYENVVSQQTEIHAEIQRLKLAIENAKNIPFAANPEISTLQNQIDTFVLPEIAKIDNGALLSEKTTLQNEINQVSATLNNAKIIKDIETRIEELMNQERDLNQELATLEQQEFLIQNFSKDRIEIIEKEINAMFSQVKWKLFEQQINGGETECCICLVNGVPFSDVNTAGKINAGLDIINTFIGKYGIIAPIWIDNKESVNQLIPTQAQVITLNVSKDQVLTIK